MILSSFRLVRELAVNRPKTEDPRGPALRAGDESVLAEVLEELLPRIHRWVFAQLGPRSDLEDATQDALFEVSKALRRFEGRASIATFARRVTLRACYRYYRKSDRREVRLELVPPPVDAIDPESKAIGREAVRRLYRCLDSLPEKRRTAFILCAVEGRSATEAAEIVGCKPGAMRARLMSARAAVGRVMRDDPLVGALLGGQS